jgi:hypothetical protein
MHDFSAKTRNALARKGITIIGLTVIPNAASDTRVCHWRTRVSRQQQRLRAHPFVRTSFGECSMNSLHLYVLDATGVEYLSTFTANTPDKIAQFRKHVESCKRYWKTAEYRKAIRNDHRGLPCFPVTIHADPYQDESQ